MSNPPHEAPALTAHEEHPGWRAFLNTRMLICVFLGFTSGLPLFTLVYLVQAWLRSEGVNLKEIGLFALIQFMYLCFYLVALFRLHAIQNIADSFLPPWGATALAGVVMVTAGTGIPLRCYLMSSIGFDYQRLGQKFRQIFPFVLALDQLWAIAPFLLIEKIGLGAAFAASAALLYVPFGERTLIQMAYVNPWRRP